MGNGNDNGATLGVRMYDEQRDLGVRLRAAGLTYRDICDLLRTPYGTVAAWFGGYNRMPDRAWRRITERAEEAEAEAEGDND